MVKLLYFLLACLCAFFCLVMGILGYFTDPALGMAGLSGMIKFMALSVVTCAIAATMGYLGEMFEASAGEHVFTACLMVAGIMGGAWIGSHALAGFFLATAACICFMLGILTDGKAEGNHPGRREKSSFG
ncbi:MAG: hypothetical protein WC767_02070 [Candidatus Paceibacterota bacterium]|jgi:hypothetical protein